VSVERAAATYRRAFGVDAVVIASAPGRVNLIGEHTDYNGGDVLPMALSLRTTVALGPSADSESHAVSEQSPKIGSFSAANPQRQRSWWDYVSGTVLELRADGVEPRPMNLAVASDVPSGAGLSSSAALEVATAFAVAAWSGRDFDSVQLARAAHRAETEFVGVPCGIMDQFASALAKEERALLLACDRQETALVPMRSPVLVFDTRTPRSLRTSAFGERRRECEAALSAVQTIDPSVKWLARASEDLVLRSEMTPTVRKRALHVVRENRRVAAFVRALQETGTLAGEQMYASHSSLRDDYECSSEELDWFVERAQEARGITGARLTGAGWGGCAIATGSAEALGGFAENSTATFSKIFRRRPRYWLSIAGDGARVELQR
jgi:galactokinase